MADISPLPGLWPCLRGHMANARVAPLLSLQLGLSNPLFKLP